MVKILFCTVLAKRKRCFPISYYIFLKIIPCGIFQKKKKEMKVAYARSQGRRK